MKLSEGKLPIQEEFHRNSVLTIGCLVRLRLLGKAATRNAVSSHTDAK